MQKLEDKSIREIVTDLLFSKPVAHEQQPRMNRAQRRSYFHNLRKQEAAGRRLKYEGRGR